MADNADTNQPTGTPETTTETAFDFAAWLASQDETVKTGLAKHFDSETAGLKSALTKERETRDALDKQLKTLSKNADKGSDLEKQLAELTATKTAAAERICDLKKQLSQISSLERTYRARLAEEIVSNMPGGEALIAKLTAGINADLLALPGA
jgi:septal ring factor EnvC (AmiA/AmiB activator)